MKNAEKLLERVGQFGIVLTMIVLIFGIVSGNKFIFIIGVAVLLIFPLGTGAIEWYYGILYKNSILFILWLTEKENTFEKLKMNILDVTPWSMLNNETIDYIQSRAGQYLDYLEEDAPMKKLKEDIENNRLSIKKLKNIGSDKTKNDQKNNKLQLKHKDENKLPNKLGENENVDE